MSSDWQTLIASKKVPSHVLRWYNLMASQNAVMNALNRLPEEAKVALQPVKSSRRSVDRSTAAPAAETRKQEGKFVDLPGAEMGKVVVRFPPEASG